MEEDIKVKCTQSINYVGRLGCLFVSSKGRVIVSSDNESYYLDIDVGQVSRVRNLASKAKGSLYVAIADGIGYILEEGV